MRRRSTCSRPGPVESSMIFHPSARSIAHAKIIHCAHIHTNHKFIHTYMHTYIYINTYINNWMTKKKNNDHKITKPYNINREASSQIFHRVEAVLNILQFFLKFCLCGHYMAYHQMVGWRKTSDLKLTLREGPP